MVCIDFTGSNGVPKYPSSLHYLNPSGELNQYQKALVSVCDVLLCYDWDKLIPTYGFGAKVKYPGYDPKIVSHFFPLNGNPNNPVGYGVEGVFGCYNQGLQNVELGGPTYFNDLIKNANEFTKRNNSVDPYNYTVMVILTDGAIHDMEETIELIIEGSSLPLSIIIVGVGNENFEEMEKLDSDQELLKGIGGKRANRDIVQFVPYKSFLNQPREAFGTHVLKELPEQVVGYFVSKGIAPRGIQDY